MKKKIKRIICVLIIVCLTALTLAGADKVMREGFSEANYNRFFAQKDNIDIIIVGSSKVDNAILPMELWGDYGITSYNFGSQSFGIDSSYWLFRNAIDYCKPKYAVLEIFNVSGGEKANDELALGLAHQGFDAFHLSKTKIQAAKDIYKNTNDQMEILFPFSMYHNRWDSLTSVRTEGKGKYNNRTICYGAEELYRIEDSIHHDEVDTNVVFDLNGNYPRVDYVKRFISDCRDNDIVPVLMCLPIEADENLQIEANTMQLLAEQEGVIFINMLGKGIIDSDTDGADANWHLNAFGARKTTKWIGEYLVTQLGLENHQNQPGYELWESDYTKYINDYVTPGVVDETDMELLLGRLEYPLFEVYIYKDEKCMLKSRTEKLLFCNPNLCGLEIVNDQDYDVRIIGYDKTTHGELTDLCFKVNPDSTYELIQ